METDKKFTVCPKVQEELTKVWGTKEIHSLDNNLGRLGEIRKMLSPEEEFDSMASKITQPINKIF